MLGVHTLGTVRDSGDDNWDQFLEDYLGIVKVSFTVSVGGGDDIPISSEGVPKIGFHTGMGGNPTGIEYYIDSMAQACKPVVIKSVDNAGPLYYAQQKVRSGCPSVLVFRSDAGDPQAGVPNYDLSPSEAARQHWDYHKSRWPPELDPSKVWIETVNEIDKNRSEWLAEFAIETGKLAIEDGFKWAAFGWATGEPEVVDDIGNDWKGPKMKEFLRFASANRGRIAIAVHEYSLTTDCIQCEYPYMIGRYKEIFRVTDEMGIPKQERPVVIITEFGWAATNVPDPGTAIEHINWANNEVYDEDPSMLGAAIWYLGGGFGGIADQANALINPVTDWALAQSPGDSASEQVNEASLIRVMNKPAQQGNNNEYFNAEQAANQWSKTFGANIDIGMQLAILEGESKGGTNMGSCSGRQAAANFSQSEIDDVDNLLAHWQEHDIRATSSIANLMIEPDYSDYVGHCSAGEIGASGFLPSTAWSICSRGLTNHSDGRVASCNLFDPYGGSHAKVWWLDAIGYDADQSRDEKFASLYGWNRDSSYRWWLINRAEQINAEVDDGDYDGGDDSGGGIIRIIEFYVYDPDSWELPQQLLFYLLQVLDEYVYDFLPEDLYKKGHLPGWIYSGGDGDPPDGEGCDPDDPPLMTATTHPFPGHEGENPTLGYMEVFNGYIHWGVDWGGDGDPVVAAHDACVRYAQNFIAIPGVYELSDKYWSSGNSVVLEAVDQNGNKITTIYGHGSELLVQPGQTVQMGQQIMVSGETGIATGPHLHFGAQQNGDWVNPLSLIPAAVSQMQAELASTPVSFADKP